MSEKLLIVRLFAVAALTIAVVVACDRVPLTSPTGSTISLSIDRNILPLNGQATVRAVVTESAGTPVHNGTTVTFQPSIGRTDPVEAQTVNGIATVNFLAGTVSGTGFIHAFSGGARTGSGNTSSGGIEVRIGAAAAGGISVSATPSSISQSGGSVAISALVMDPSNNPLPGVSVLFTATAGTLSATTALSDANGIARTQLTTTQTTTVTATAGTARGEVQVLASTAPAITLTVPETGTVGVPVAITASVTAGGTGGNNTPRQVQSLVLDFGDGTSETRTNVTGSAGFTHTYQQARGYVVTATATDVAGNTGTASDGIVINRSNPPTVGVSSNPQFGNAPFNATITVTAAPGANGASLQSVRTFVNGTLVHTGTGNASFAHRFSTPGNYTIETVATDTSGNESRASTVVIAE
jgi:hypothetical protein